MGACSFKIGHLVTEIRICDRDEMQVSWTREESIKRNRRYIDILKGN